MPYYHCNDCHHEFEHIPLDEKKMPKCDWCGADSYILEPKTPLEIACEPENMKKILGELCAYEWQKSCNTRKH